MALAHLRAAQECAIENPHDKFILTTIAADIGHDGSPAYPSLRTIAERCALSKDTVARAIARLSAAGWIVIKPKGKSQCYALGAWCDNVATIDTREDATPMSATSREVATINGRIETMEQQLSQIVATLSQIVAQLSQNSPELSHDCLTLSQNEPKLSHESRGEPSLSRSKEVIEEEVKKNKSAGPGLSLKWGRDQFVQEFNGQLPSLWPLIESFQRECDLPTLPTFYGSLWEAIGYDTFTPDDVGRIAAVLRQLRPNDNLWPSSVLNYWRKEQRDKLRRPVEQDAPELLVSTF